MVENIKRVFGKQLKMLRHERGLTQEELGRAVNVDYKHIGAIERGLRAPSFDVIERLAKVLKVVPYQLFLPVEQKNVDLNAEIDVAVSRLSKSQRTLVQRLLQELLRAAKKMDIR